MRYAFDFVDAVLFFIELAEFLIVRPLILLIYYIIHNQIKQKFNKLRINKLNKYSRQIDKEYVKLVSF